MPDEVKQIIVIRKDLKMRRGKEIAQGSHASMAWLSDAVKGAIDCDSAPVLSTAERIWIFSGFTKIVCAVKTEAELKDLYDKAVNVGLHADFIIDSGRTEFGGKATYTAVAIGPDYASKLDPITGNLKLY